jgi:hypothetical protein
MKVKPVKKISQADFAFCDVCNQQLGGNGLVIDPVFTISKSIHLHESGTGHKVNKEISLYAIDEPAK